MVHVLLREGQQSRHMQKLPEKPGYGSAIRYGDECSNSRAYSLTPVHNEQETLLKISLLSFEYLVLPRPEEKKERKKQLWRNHHSIVLTVASPRMISVEIQQSLAHVKNRGFVQI